ncbi:hypothetical protein PanWU01x14_338710 [Parasponia andersonii]|uniref:Uncharacterized protein n=1 Tax=Parasponia andersonii TaxID=3476 RepID=A0A2P5AF17_PARAD|nr:hypothetical protein PanWU01x14_338710 [Parasponia andersonii]
MAVRRVQCNLIPSLRHSLPLLISSLMTPQSSGNQGGFGYASTGLGTSNSRPGQGRGNQGKGKVSSQAYAVGEADKTQDHTDRGVVDGGRKKLECYGNLFTIDGEMGTADQYPWILVVSEFLDFFTLTGIHPMQLNANSFIILMGLSALSVLYNIHIDLEGLSRSDKQWDSHSRLYAVGGAWCPPWVNGEHFKAGRLKDLEGIVIFGTPGDYRHIQLAGSYDLVELTSHDLEEAVRLVAEECVRLRSDPGLSADPSPIKGSTAVHKARSKVSTGRHLVVSSEDEAHAVPSPGTSRPPTRETTAIKVVYGKGVPSSLPRESATLTSSTPNSSSKTSTGSGTACPCGEIAELSRGAPRLKSRLSSPPLVPIKRHHEADSSKEKEGPVGKRGRFAPSSDSDDDEAMLTLMRRRRSACGGPSGGIGQDKTEKSHSGGAPRTVAIETVDAAVVTVASSAEDMPPPAIVEGTLGDTQLSTVPTTAASGASKKSYWSMSAVEPELEALSLENVELVAGCNIAQLAAIKSFYSSHVRELNSRSTLAERSEAALAELKVDFDLYQSLDEARIGSAVAHALSVKRVRHKELVAKLIEVEADRLAQSKAARLAQNELRVKE